MIFHTFVEEGAREKGNNTGIRGETLRNRGASGEEDKGDKRTEDKGTRGQEDKMGKEECLT